MGKKRETSQERLEVVLDDLVQGRLSRAPRTVGGGPQLVAPFADHAGGNYRTLTNLAGEILARERGVPARRRGPIFRRGRQPIGYAAAVHHLTQPRRLSMSQQSEDGSGRPEALAAEILNALTAFPEAGELVLGGYFALRQYADHRTTNDVDAWWRTGRTESTMACLRQVMSDVAERRGLAFAERAWGETASFELSEAGRKIFSFQVAARSVELEPPAASRWPPVLVETLADNLGSKMSALVQRGAPRDFVDVHEAVVRGIASVEQCWDWWSRKNPGVDPRLARAQALRHLEGIEQRRPIDSIEDPEERDTARRTRAWIRRALLDLPAGPGHAT